MDSEPATFVDDAVILSVELREAPAMLPGFASGQNEVVVTVAGQEPGVLFSYFVDELTFTAEEFRGMTVRKARQLFYDRDIAYLRAP